MRTPLRWAAAACCAAAAAGCTNPHRDAAEARGAASAAAPADLVLDLRLGTAPADSSPHGFVVSGTNAFFAADDGESGFEPWRTDGTAAGTARALDVRPGGPSSLPSPPRAAGDPVFEAVPFVDPLPPNRPGILFAADDGARGVELWFTDGTEAGTRLVKDIELGSGSSSPAELTVVGSTVFFVATTRANGPDLWKTNGTSAGTQRVATGATDPGLRPGALAALAGKLYFAAPYGGAMVLWRSDGSQGGTAPVRTTAPYDPGSLTAFGEEALYLVASDVPGGTKQLWRLDASSGTVAVVGDAGTNPADPSLLTPVLAGPHGPRLFYAARAGTAVDLFSTDGVSQIRRTYDDVRPAAIATAGGGVFVSASLPAVGRELCAWNGSALEALLDVAPGGDSNPVFLTDVGGILLFGAVEAGAPALFRSDGQPGPGRTYRVFGSGGPDVGEMIALPTAAGPRALFAGGDAADGVEPWLSDGTSFRTGIVSDLRPDVASSSPGALAAWSGRLLFSADDGISGREPWIWDGAPRALYDVNLGSQHSEADDFVSLGDTVLFSAADYLHGRELRWTDGASVGLVKDVLPGSGSSLVRAGARPVRLGDRVLFAADDGSGLGRELWRTDGTQGGTALVDDLWSGVGSSNPRALVASGPHVWFAADDGAASSTRPYRSDGTAAGTRAEDLTCGGDVVADPIWFADLGGSAVFSGFEPGMYGRELFRFDPDPAYSCLVVLDASPGLDADWNPYSSDPAAFVVHGGVGFFAARDGAAGYALWRTDGWPSGTTRVAAVGTHGAGSVSSPVSVPNVGQPPRSVLFFVGNDEVNGPELWTSEGLSTTTRMVVDAMPGVLGSADGSALLALPWRGHVLYAANDGVSGRELWISNGTELGTRLVQDLRAGAASSNPADLTAVGELVFFTADDGTTGRELWVLDTSAAAFDLTAPDPGCAGTVYVEANGPAGADPSPDPLFAISPSDDRGGPVAVSYLPPPDSHLDMGTTAVLATARDEAGNRARCSFPVHVRDTTAPALTCPAALQVEATMPEGADVHYLTTVWDAVTAAPVVTRAPEPGSRFALGPGKQPLSTTVDVSARDVAGNVSTCSFPVTVADTTAPALACPADVSFEATGPAGAAATWADASASDAVTVPTTAIAIGYLLPDDGVAVRGSTFALGATTVRATATDEAGNRAVCPFTVRVADTTPPQLTCPSVDPVEATTYLGSPVTFAAIAGDAVDPSPAVTYSPAPGSFFEIGTHAVAAFAQDDAENVSSCAFSVTVQDTLAPVVACPGPLVVAEATEAGGAAVLFDATAVDTADPSPQISFEPASGTTVALDTVRTVVATARDDVGNESTCAFDVTVRDRTAPALTRACPFTWYTEASGPAGAAVTFPRDFAHDLVTPDPELAWSYSQTPGDPQPLGSVTVIAQALDARSNVSAPCAFVSTVRDTIPPFAVCPAPFRVEATAPAGADVAWPDATAVDLVTDPLPPPVYDAVWGPFPLGSTVVHATFTDAAGNSDTCEIRFAVVDTTAPALECPAPAPVEATGPAGAAVTFDAFPLDSVTAVPVLSFSAPPGSTFPVGSTEVIASAWDDAGNVTTCAFAAIVVDTTPPSIDCEPVATAEATGPGGVAGVDVTFAVSAGDVVTAAPALSYSPPLDQLLPLGTSTVTITARDASLNAASCAVSVFVRDTTPPAIVCPPDRTVEANDATAVQFPLAAATDLVTAAPAVTASPPSGSVFAIGTTPVTFTATDDAGNAAQCTMRVTVGKAVEPGGCGCGTGSAGSTGLLALLALVLRARSRRPRDR